MNTAILMRRLRSRAILAAMLADAPGEDWIVLTTTPLVSTADVFLRGLTTDAVRLDFAAGIVTAETADTITLEI